MPAQRTTLFGWSPDGGSDYELVDLSLPIHNFSPSNSRSSFPTTAKSSDDPPPPADPSVQSNQRDPGWVARPRNPFIIFRCQYSRDHCRDNRRGDRTTNEADADKTLSKRAAEAWTLLPSSEKLRYKELAAKEKEEHARLNPNYRFRPLKRQVDKKHSARRSSKKSNSPKSKALPISPDPVIDNAPQSSSELASSPTLPQSSAEVEYSYSVKADRRRSSSVPTPVLVVDGEYTYPGMWSLPAAVLQKADKRRSQSSDERTGIVFSECLSMDGSGAYSYDPRLTMHSNTTSESFPDLAYSSSSSIDDFPELYPSCLQTPQASQEDIHASSSSEYDAPVHFVSPLSMVASSLIGWNGQLTSGGPKLSNPTVPIPSPQRNFAGTKFFEDPPLLSATDSCNATSQSYAGMIPWGCVSSSSSSQSTDSFDAPQIGEVGSSSLSHDDELERAQALVTRHMKVHRMVDSFVRSSQIWRFSIHRFNPYRLLFLLTAIPHQPLPAQLFVWRLLYALYNAYVYDYE